MRWNRFLARLGLVLILAATACDQEECGSPSGQDASIPMDAGDTCADRYPGPCSAGVFDITKNPAVPSGRILYSYDSRGNLVRKETYSYEIAADDEDGGALPVEELTSVGVYTYGEQDRLVKAEFDEDGDGDVDVIYIYKYDDEGDLPETGRETNVVCGNITMNGACFDFGKGKLKEAEIDSNGDGIQDGRVTYDYDDKGRLIGIETDEYLFGFPNRTERFIYDDAGNRIRWDIDNGTFATYQYDERGNVIRIDGSEYLYDENCNRIGTIIRSSKRHVADFDCWKN